MNIFVHLPLSGAIVLVAATLSKMIKTKEIGQGHQGYFGVSESPACMSCPTMLNVPKTRDGNGYAVTCCGWLPTPLARRGALDAPAPLGAHPLRHLLHHIPARPRRQCDLRHRGQHGLPRARRRRGDGGEDLPPRTAGRQAGLRREQQGGARVRGGRSDRGPDTVRKVRGPRCVFGFAQITDGVWNSREAEVDNTGTVSLLRSLSLPKNYRKAFATAV